MENILKKSMTKPRRSVQNTNQLFLEPSNLSFFIDEKLMEISDFDTFKVIRWIHENGKVKLTLFGDEELKETKSLGGPRNHQTFNGSNEAEKIPTFPYTL